MSTHTEIQGLYTVFCHQFLGHYRARKIIQWKNRTFSALPASIGTMV